MKNRYFVTVAAFLAFVTVTGCGKTSKSMSSGIGIKDGTGKETLPPLKDEAMDIGKTRTSEEDLQNAKKTPGAVKPEGLEDILFDFDQWSIRPEAVRTLENNVFWLHENPTTKIQLEGYCDEKGTSEYNLVLGEQRAKAVMAFVTDLGVSPDRIAVISYGEEQKVCSEDSEACHQKNRRVHFSAK
jgi:peptidoglycan-associated lipoprotein